MITIGISKWPNEKGKQVGETSLKAKPMPDFVQMLGPYMYPGENDGFRVSYTAGTPGPAFSLICSNIAQACPTL